MFYINNEYENFLDLLLGSFPWAMIYTGLCAIGVVTGFLLYFANGLLGNPISKMIAEKAAEDYMAEMYSDKDFVIEDLTYNFKDGNYCANIESPSSIDTYFSVNISMGGKIQNDSYENVLNGWNTYQRIGQEI